MHIDVKHRLTTAWNSIARSATVRLPLLTAAEQTRLSWARRVESYDELPEFYKSFVDALLRDTGAFPYLVLTPTFKGFFHPENEKLVCSTDHETHILEKVGSRLVPTCYSVGDISYLEVGMILLQAWITMRGIAGDSLLTSSTLKFNAVTRYLFDPILGKIRSAPDGCPGVDLNVERAKFDYLCSLNFKFMNFARASILPGERVIYVLLQPQIRARLLAFLGRSFFRTISPAHLSILTDTELIMIRDDHSEIWRQQVKYGGIWTYIPLDKIRRVSLAKRDEDLLVLSIYLPADDHVDVLFSASMQPEVEELLVQFEHLMPGVAKEAFLPGLGD
jgi:hypothetical protein